VRFGVGRYLLHFTQVFGLDFGCFYMDLSWLGFGHDTVVNVPLVLLIQSRRAGLPFFSSSSSPWRPPPSPSRSARGFPLARYVMYFTPVFGLDLLVLYRFEFARVLVRMVRLRYQIKQI